MRDSEGGFHSRMNKAREKMNWKIGSKHVSNKYYKILPVISNTVNVIKEKLTKIMHLYILLLKDSHLSFLYIFLNHLRFFSESESFTHP